MQIQSLINRLNEVAPRHSLPPIQSRFLERWEDWELHHILGQMHSEEAETIRRIEKELARIENDLRQKAVPDAPSEDSIEAAEKLLSRFLINSLQDTIYGLDYALELRAQIPLISPTSHSLIYFTLISVDKREGLAREDHGWGYHFHHVNLRGGITRTNVLLTFDPSEPLGPPDRLFWEHHGGYDKAEPARWSPARRRAMYSAARPSLVSPGKAKFKRPGDDCGLLWQQ
jgi:hypothetical protein